MVLDTGTPFGGRPCHFCGHQLDPPGVHCLSLHRGDTTTQHIARDVDIGMCEEAGLRPARLWTAFQGQPRQGDVLCIPSLALPLAPFRPRAIPTEPVCFEFMVMSAFGPLATDGTGALASDHDSKAKEPRNDSVHGIRGRTAKDADCVIRAICKSVGS